MFPRTFSSYLLFTVWALLRETDQSYRKLPNRLEHYKQGLLCSLWVATSSQVCCTRFGAGQREIKNTMKIPLSWMWLLLDYCKPLAVFQTPIKLFYPDSSCFIFPWGHKGLELPSLLSSSRIDVLKYVFYQQELVIFSGLRTTENVYPNLTIRTEC